MSMRIHITAGETCGTVCCATARSAASEERLRSSERISQCPLHAPASDIPIQYRRSCGESRMNGFLQLSRGRRRRGGWFS